MVLFTILTVIILLLIAFVFFIVTVGGAGFVIVFGDVIVCIVLIGLILKFIISRRK